MNNINEGMTQKLIRTFVKKAFHDIKEEPQRNIRNLVDMALNFSNGRFQKNFFESAQELLRNEQSAYYKLIQDLVLSVDTDRILTFGMNVGYTSCTAGAEVIRKIEQEQGFNIPWSLTLITDLQKNANVMPIYSSLIQQGKELGIYTWLIFSSNRTPELLPLIKTNPDCGFILFCQAEEVTEALLSEADSLPNLMFSIEYGEAAVDTCARLRQKKLLYSVHIPYQEKDAASITSGEFLCWSETLHPIFTLFIPPASCSEATRHLIYDYVRAARNAQEYQTIPMDLVYDNLYIDSIISNDSCSAGFDSSGNLWNMFHTNTKPEYNIFQNKLSDILRLSFPKL